MRYIQMTKKIGGSANCSNMNVTVEEKNTTPNPILGIFIEVDRDCIVGESAGLYRTELNLLFQEALNAYIRTS